MKSVHGFERQCADLAQMRSRMMARTVTDRMAAVAPRVRARAAEPLSGSIHAVRRIGDHQVRHNGTYSGVHPPTCCRRTAIDEDQETKGHTSRLTGKLGKSGTALPALRQEPPFR